MKDDDVSADFEVSTIAAHRAMAQEMGIQWTPEPDKDSHLSVTLVNARGETLTGLSVELAVTDPAGNVTRHVANVMSAPGMHHYGIDFQRTIPGAHRVAAVFDFDGHRHTLATTIDVP